MIPQKSEVLKILEKAKQNPRNEGWVIHSIIVGDAAGRLAAALNKSGQKLDVDKITTLGYLHDIGKMVGPYRDHPLNGYNYLKEQGYDEDYCRICLTHSFVNNDPYCMFSEFMNPEIDGFVIDYVQKCQFTIEDKIITLCDHMVYEEIFTLEKRMINVIMRHGVCDKTVERIKATYALKEYFDKLLGYNMYDIFPEAKENL